MAEPPRKIMSPAEVSAMIERDMEKETGVAPGKDKP
jgi:hypothetical protein